MSVETLNGVFGSHNGDADKLRRRLTDIEASITKIEGRMDVLEASKIEIDAEVTSLDARITTLEGIKINELIYDGPAESLQMCGKGCSDCRKGHYSFYPNFPIYQCVDSTIYMYGDACDMSVTTGQWSVSTSCNTDFGQKCHMAWPQEDRMSYSSF